MSSRVSPHDEVNSRAAFTGDKRSASSSMSDPNQNPVLRKRRRQDSGERAEHSTVSVNDSRFQSHVALDSSYPPPSSAPSTNDLTSAMASYGKNRLRSGFVKHPKNATLDATSSIVSTSASLSTGESTGSAIEISEDEDEDEEMDSEGGIVINIEGNQHKPIVLSDEEGEIGQDADGDSHRSPPSSTPASAAAPETPAFVVDPTPAQIQKRLVDLDKSELERQMSYAFYHLERDQIDLSRPVICLSCHDEGHLSYECQAPGLFPTPSTKAPIFRSGEAIKLWISCCKCASKSHLVGDCPRADKVLATTWSLKTLNPDQILNLSLQSGTVKLEKEVENRGIRPPGLQIKGRAGLHRAGGRPSQASTDSEDEPFLHSRRNDNQSRYDRFDPPGARDYRPPTRGPWYSTDSFGRRRSRSPARNSGTDSYRPGDRQPPPNNARRGAYQPAASSRSANGISIPLPSRPASNPGRPSAKNKKRNGRR